MPETPDATGGAESRPRTEMENGPSSNGPGRVVRDKAGEGLEHAGEALRRVARKAESKGGPASRVAPAADRLGEGFDEAAEYLRETELEEMRRDLETAVRDRPIRSLAIAAVAGYLLGRILR